MRVFVYFNLHKKCFSIKALEGADKGRVIAHRDTVVLDGCKLLVSEAGRQRVLREKRKNVHAGVSGTWINYCTNRADINLISSALLVGKLLITLISMIALYTKPLNNLWIKLMWWQ